MFFDVVVGLLFCPLIPIIFAMAYQTFAMVYQGAALLPLLLYSVS